MMLLTTGSWSRKNYSAMNYELTMDQKNDPKITDSLMFRQNYCESIADDIPTTASEMTGTDRTVIKLSKKWEFYRVKSIVHYGFPLPIIINRTTKLIFSV